MPHMPGIFGGAGRSSAADVDAAAAEVWYRANFAAVAGADDVGGTSVGALTAMLAEAMDRRARTRSSGYVTAGMPSR